jgi:hypothetical protein
MELLTRVRIPERMGPQWLFRVGAVTVEWDESKANEHDRVDRIVRSNDLALCIEYGRKYYPLAGSADPYEGFEILDDFHLLEHIDSLAFPRKEA